MFTEGFDYPIIVIVTFVVAAVTGAIGYGFSSLKAGRGETPGIRFSGRRSQ